jgi:hypothetical protein
VNSSAATLVTSVITNTLLYSHGASYGWQSLNLSTLIGLTLKIKSDPTAWLISYTNTDIVHLAVEESDPNTKQDNKLLVISLNSATLI